MADIDRVPGIARSIFDRSRYLGDVLNRIGDDDCAIMRDGSRMLVLTTDLMNHRPALMTLNIPNKYFNYGYLVATANLSDLYGTGATPIAMLIGLLVPDSMSDDQVARVLAGVRACCEKHRVAVIGGDTKRADRLQGYGVGIGQAMDLSHMFTRNGVMPRQHIFLSGDVGDFNAATYLLASGSCPPEWIKAARKIITRPILRRRLSLGVARAGLATGGIDISDGLGLDLWRLADVSGVKLTVNSESIPVGGFAKRVAERLRVDPLAFVFATGGDWQFAFTADPSNFDACVRLGGQPVGTAEAGKGCWLKYQDRLVPLPRFGHSDNRGLDFGAEVQVGVKEFMGAQAP